MIWIPLPEGHSREIDDYQPRAQIKRHVKERKLTLEDSDSIAEFSKTFAFQELHVRKYLEHPQYLEVEKSKQKDDRNWLPKEVRWLQLGRDVHGGDAEKAKSISSESLSGKAPIGK